MSESSLVSCVWNEEPPNLPKILEEMSKRLKASCMLPPTPIAVISEARFRWLLRLWAANYSQELVKRSKPIGGWFWVSMTKRRSRVIDH